MSIFDFFKGRNAKKGVPADAVDAEQAQLLALLLQATRPSQTAIDTDRFPNGTGEFGYSLDNPVPCSSILGSNDYLSKLRWKGQPVENSRIGSFTSQTIERPIDGYALTAADGQPLGTVYISPYQKKNSASAPKGLTLV